MELIRSAGAPDTGETTAEVPQESDVATGDDPVVMLYELLQRDPGLAAKMADLIEHHYGGGNMEGYSFAPEVPAPAATPPATSVPPATTPQPAASQQALPPELLARLDRVEQEQANMAVERELADVRKEYEALKQDFPILPELADEELLQIALDKGGIPLKDALLIWAVDKMRQGETPVADRITAHMLEQSKAKKLPGVEGKGGSIPSGEAQPPQSLKEARAFAKDRLKALFGGVSG